MDIFYAVALGRILAFNLGVCYIRRKIGTYEKRKEYV